MIEEIEDWNRKPIRITRSRGSGVTAVLDVEDQLLRKDLGTYGKGLLKQSGGIDSFHASTHSALAAKLGHYCRLQSLNSEDVATWNYFESLLDAPASLRTEFCQWLLAHLGLDYRVSNNPQFALWRRILHPDTNSQSTGPEVDFYIDCGGVIILGEAKWNSSLGEKQGITKNSNQIQLRHKYLQLHLNRLHPEASAGLVLGLGRERHLIPHQDESSAGRQIHMRSITWTQLAKFAMHPKREEFSAYLSWKEQHSTPLPRHRDLPL